MRATAWLPRSPSPGRPWLTSSRADLAWGVLSVACLAAMIAVPDWETIPFHLIWISLTLLYGFRVWPLRKTAVVLGLVMATTGASITTDTFEGSQLWGELFEVPLMSAMFVAMVWHAQRRAAALRTVEALADERATLLEQEERLLHDVSHELRTPVTIARGHLELLQRELGDSRPELSVAFDELARIDDIVERLLLLARAERPDSVTLTSVALVPFLEDVFMRWAEIAPRAWQLGEIADVTLEADEAWLRAALDALLENAVHYTDDYARIELSARRDGTDAVLAVSDSGQGIAPDALEVIFDRFGRSDTARTRREGGAGLGLAIVQAIARAHRGACTVRSVEGEGSVFELRLPLGSGQPAVRRAAAPGFREAVPEPGSA